MSRNSITPWRAFRAIGELVEDDRRLALRARAQIPDRHRAGGRRLRRAALHLDQAHAAIAGDRQPLVIAEARDFGAGGFAGLEQRVFGGNVDPLPSMMILLMRLFQLFDAPRSIRDWLLQFLLRLRRVRREAVLPPASASSSPGRMAHDVERRPVADRPPNEQRQRVDETCRVCPGAASQRNPRRRAPARPPATRRPSSRRALGPARSRPGADLPR